MLAFVAAVGISAMFSVLFEADSERIGFPRSLFTLPVPTRTLVFWPWLFGAAGWSLVGVLFWLLFGLLIDSFDQTDVPVGVALVLAVCSAWLQVALWTPSRNPLVKSLALGFGTLLPAALAGWLYFRSGLPEYATVGILVAVLALSYPAALAGAARDRRGDAWLSGPAITWPRWMRRRGPGPSPKPFPSPVHAQRWYYWSSPPGLAGRLVYAPLVPLVFGLVFVFSLLGTQILNPHLTVLLFTVGYPVFFLLMGLLLADVPIQKGAKPFGPRENLMFASQRPIGSGRLAVTLLRTLLHVILSSWAIWLPIGLMACLGWSAFSDVPAGILRDLKLFFGRLSVWQSVGVAALSAVALVGGTWRLVTDMLTAGTIGQRGRPTYLSVSLAIIGLNALVTVGISLLLDPATRAPAVDALTGAGVVILAVKLVVSGLAFRVADRDGLLEGLSLRTFFLVWLVLVVVLLGTTAVLVSSLGLPVPTSLVLLWVAILLPLGRFALLPLGLEALRHR
jgi:hypothetical protein